MKNKKPINEYLTAGERNQNNNQFNKGYNIGDVGPAGGIISMQHNDGTFVECWTNDEPEKMDWDEAREHVKNLNHGGYNDWSLPTKEELDKIQRNKDQIGNFQIDFYWSDTEHSEYNAWNQDFITGGQNYYSRKCNYWRVRAVRRFKNDLTNDYQESKVIPNWVLNKFSKYYNEGK